MLFGPDQLGLVGTCQPAQSTRMVACAPGATAGAISFKCKVMCSVVQRVTIVRSAGRCRVSGVLSFLYDPHMRMSLVAFTRSSQDHSQVDRTDRLPEALSRIT